VDALFRANLPMIYNLVRQALGGSPDVDDVVQDIVLRALRKLPELREAERFRSWLATIAVREIGTHLAHTQATAGRAAPLDAAAWKPDAGIEGPALLRVELARQRRQVRNASRWLSTDDRALMALWWLETAEELSRAEVAAALGVSVAHASVRLQRMREHLELSRTIVAALEAVPGCDELSAAIANWNGVPSPFWRKRLARHTRSCRVCRSAAEEMMPAERLLAVVAPVPLPVALADLAAQHGAAGPGPAGAGVVGRILAALRSQPWAVATVAGVALVVTIAVVTAGRSAPGATATAAPVLGAPASATSAAPSPPVLPSGPVSLESANTGGRFISVTDGRGALVALEPASSAAARRRATFEVVAGLADKGCYTFRTFDGLVLRHASWRLTSAPEEGTVLLRRDATFCVRAGAAPGTLSLESSNYPGYFVRHVGTELWVDQDDGSVKFRADSSFRVHSALS
jgi:RNA polymerase sigma factor (sigma-70 family)